ncbi:MAG: TRAP transporter substrate-binding protein DctP [Proteobacteria bacterium]|nr:TRAP transporter substrate-binding protein DctP [Pseudomonadota bacterium]
MNKPDRWKRGLIAVAMSALISGFGITSVTQASDEFDEVKLRYAGYLPATHARELFTQKWMDEVTKRSNGRVTFDTYRDQALLKTLDLLDGASRGISDISYLATGYYPSQLPLSTMADLPFLSNNSQALLASLLQIYGEFDGMQKEYDDNNLVLLTGISGDPTILGSNEPLMTVEDLKGKRIRAFGLINQALDVLGAVPVALPAPDIYASMERNVIEAYSGLPASLITPWSLHEVSKYVIDYGAGLYASNAIVMNKTRFSGLNDKTQALLKDTFAELLKDVYIADLAKLNRERAKSMQDSKMEIVRWSKEEREKAAKLVRDKVWEEAIVSREKRGVPARAFVARFVEIIAENEPKSTGYIDPVSAAIGRPD